MNQIMINAHHHALLLKAHLKRAAQTGVEISVSEEQEILGTGGGIKKTTGFWDNEPFVVINGDTITDIDLMKAYQAHQRSGRLATLILHDHTRYNKISLDKHASITDIPKAYQPGQPGKMAFTGIHIMDPGILDAIPKDGFSDIMDTYRCLIRDGVPIGGYVSENHYWCDMGSLESYMEANTFLLGDKACLVGPGCRVHPEALLRKGTVIGKNTVIEKGVEISRSIIWENTIIHAGLCIEDSIVTSSQEVTTSLKNQIL
jgi:NDP-sugar pyrophosphorylase family protein